MPDTISAELAFALCENETLTLAQAIRRAGVSQLDFQALLAEHQIPIHYGIEEFREDLRTLGRRKEST